jgi:nucleoporin NUP1
MPTVIIPAPTFAPPASQPPAIALVPPTPEGPQMDKPVSERKFPDFSSTFQALAHTGESLPQSDSNSASKPVPQGVDKHMAVSKSESVATTPERSASHAPIASAQTSSLETQGPSLAPFNFGPIPPTLPTLTSSSSQPSSATSLPFSLTPSSAVQLSEKKDDAGVAPAKPLFGGATTSFPTPVSAPGPNAKPATQSAEAITTPFSFPKAATPAAAERAGPLKPGFSLAQSSLMPVSVSEPTLSAEASKPPKLSTPFSFDQPAKETTTAAPSTPAKNIFTFGASSAAPSTAEKPVVTSIGFTLGSSTTAPASAPTGLPFGSPAAQSETKPAASTGGFSFGTPAPTLSDAPKPGFSFGVTTPIRSLTPPPADDGMRMEESPTRGGRMDVNGGSAKPQSLPQLQMPGSSKPGFSFSTGTGTGFGSPSPSPFEGNSRSGFTFGQQSQPSSQGVSGGFAFSTNKKASESLTGGFSFPTPKPAENAAPTGFTFGQPTTDDKPSPSTGFSFSQQGPKTADATSSGFSFKAPEPIQHSTSFTFGQTLPEPVRPSSAGFPFGQAPPQQPATTAPFTFSSPASGGAFGSAPASPAFGTQPLAPASSTPFPFAGPTSAPPQQPGPNPFGFGSGAGQPTSPAVQQGFTFNYGGGMPPTPTGPFGTSTPQTQTTNNGGSAIFTMGTPSPQAAPPPGARPVRKLPTRRNANARR